MNQSSAMLLLWCLLLWWMSSVVDASAAFSPQFISPTTASFGTKCSYGQRGNKRICQRRITNPTRYDSCASHPSCVAVSANDEEQRDTDTGVPHHETYQYSCDVSKEVPMQTDKSRLRKLLSKSSVSEGEEEEQQQKQQQDERRFRFSYDTNILELTGNEAASTATTGIILIHPIGVGIGKWFYNRLLESIYEHYYKLRREESDNNSKNYVVAVPDLLGSGTACNPSLSASSSSSQMTEVKELPLLTVQDWSTQMSQLMVHLEADFPRIDRWCLVANGGCSPIALQVAAQESLVGARRDSFERPVKNVVLSSVPRLPFFLPEKDDDEDRRVRFQNVQKAYKRLCGILGRLFWWYALRRNGKFIQKFSEKNLVADPKNLGDDWVPNCVATARMHNGKSRYSTFSFLAGSLQVEGCRDSLDALKRHSNDAVKVDIIRGRDRRRNQAKSWFWQKRKQNQPATAAEQQESLQQVLERNGNRAKVLESGGRVSLAYEDAPGYANALFDILN